MKIYNLIHFEFFSINHNFIRSVPLVIHFEEKITCIQKNFQISPQIAFNFSSFYRISYVFFWKPARGNSSGTLPLMWSSEIRRNEFRYIVSRDDESVASSPELFSVLRSTHNTEQTVSLHSIFSINFIHCIASGLCSPLVYYLVSFHHCSWASSESCLFSFPSSSLSFSPTHHTSSPNIKIIYKKLKLLFF